MSIIDRKWGNAKKHNEQILEHNRLNLTYGSSLIIPEHFYFMQSALCILKCDKIHMLTFTIHSTSGTKYKSNL